VTTRRLRYRYLTELISELWKKNMLLKPDQTGSDDPWSISFFDAPPHQGSSWSIQKKDSLRETILFNTNGCVLACVLGCIQLGRGFCSPKRKKTKCLFNDSKSAKYYSNIYTISKSPCRHVSLGRNVNMGNRKSPTVEMSSRE
jgi:hypothetical protein